MQDDLTFKRAARTNPIHFITKPFSDLQLQRSIELSVRNLANAQEENWENDLVFKDHLFIKVRHKLEKIAIDSILFVEADGRYCQICTEEKKYLVRLSLFFVSKGELMSGFTKIYMPLTTFYSQKASG